MVRKALDQRFPTRIPQNPRISLGFGKNYGISTLKCLNTAKMLKHPAKCHGDFVRQLIIVE
jgi:hypothetical protein